MPSNPRPSFERIYMDMAKSISARSTCKRLNVGCVITSTDFRKVLSIGYNGNASGLPNQCDSEEPGRCGCLHGEDNAIINCESPRSTEKIVFCTHLPCSTCAKRFINLGGVRKIFYETEYRSLDSLSLFAQVGIVVEKM